MVFGAGLLLIGLAIGIIQVLGGIKESGPSPISDIDTDTPVAIATTEVPAQTLTSTNAHTMMSTEIPIETQTLKPTFGIGSEMLNPIDGAEMVYVPEGEFTVGSEESYALVREGPEHIVFIDSYWIYKYEVTNEEFRQCIEFGACDNDLVSHPKNDYPAIYVDWYDANSYCEWIGGRLPTEAEWEKAARGIYNMKFPWGNDVWCPVGGHVIPESNYDYIGCLDEGPGPIGGFPKGASPYGAMDMAGNVWEWTSDWYSAEYYENSPIKNPTGPVYGDLKVLRGGSWAYDYHYARVSYRFFAAPVHNSDEVGFRCVVDMVP
jgi:formylglycine-generating enzyme required for sulfatase activity